VTFHNVQPWFGVIVHWNGLVYADALFQLARYRRTDGAMDWFHLAEGMARHGMQEQIGEGPHLGMYPDAFSTVKGDEEYTWWLNPQLLGLNTFPLAGLLVHMQTTVVKAATPFHITSGGTVSRAEMGEDNTLRFLLDHQPGAASFTLVAAENRPASITCEGTPLPEHAQVEAVAQGWQWLPDHRVALIKIEHRSPSVAVCCSWEDH
jgi:hypothetical protein